MVWRNIRHRLVAVQRSIVYRTRGFYFSLPDRRPCSDDLWFRKRKNKYHVRLVEYGVGICDHFKTIGILNSENALILKKKCIFLLYIGMITLYFSTDEKIVFLPQWNLLKIKRFDNKASIQLNDGNITTSNSHTPLVELNLELPLFVGGLP